MTLQEQIAAKQLEIDTLSDILAIGVLHPSLRWSDLCVQRAEAMASLNALMVLQGVLKPAVAPTRPQRHNGA